jgi:hypothetical protein
MDVAEFEDLIDCLGDNLAVWPPEKAAAAIDLLGVSPEAREIRRQARALRQAFEARPAASASATLIGRILDEAAVTPQQIEVRKPVAAQGPPRVPRRQLARTESGVFFLARAFRPGQRLALAAAFAVGLIVSTQFSMDTGKAGLLETSGSVLEFR